MTAPKPRRKDTSDRHTQASKTLVLASTSPFRMGLLKAAGIAFEAVPPGVDEIAPPNLSPREIASHLANLKAQAVSLRIPEAIVIGSDQIAELDGLVLRKPKSRRDARRQLMSMAGRTHCLHTALVVCRQAPRVRRSAVESVKLTMRELTSKQIDGYLDTAEWEGCAGGYRIEGQGIRLFDSIKGDFHAIVGLPIVRLLKMLRAIGVEL